ncbi:MAG: tRNA (adenosine(37)-N6)-threonylcarbamoyltransferase complex ATPase subunit type 1 TsaE, partial [Acidimicrobiales bacterium]
MSQPEAIVATTIGPEETRALAGAIARLCEPGDVLLLAGDLGSGKTTFAQGFGRGLGVRVDQPG